MGQFMVSRPIISGALTGWLLGQPLMGFTVGAFIELFSLVALPSGGTRLAASASGTVAAVATAAALPVPGAYPVAVVWGLVLAHAGGYGVEVLRRWNARRWAAVEEQGITAHRVTVTHWRAIALDGLRAAVVAGGGALIGRFAFRGVADLWPLDEAATFSVLLLFAAVDMGVLLKNFGGWHRRRVVFLFGIVVGVSIGMLV
jgi:mannose/fructose/N-acetylgalactosamine-specific phosphotransferase system component IIC